MSSLVRITLFIAIASLSIASAMLSCSGDDDDDHDVFIRSTVTNQDGEAVFIDRHNGTKNEVKLFDDRNEQDQEEDVPIPGINVQFHDHAEFALFFAQDPQGVFLPRVFLDCQCQYDFCGHYRWLDGEGDWDSYNPESNAERFTGIEAFEGYVLESRTLDACVTREDLEADASLVLWLLGLDENKILGENMGFAEVMEYFNHLEIPDCFEKRSYAPQDPISVTLTVLIPADCCGG